MDRNAHECSRPPSRWNASNASIIACDHDTRGLEIFTHSGWSPVGIRHDDRRPGIRGQSELAAAEHSATAATRLVDPDWTSPTAKNPGWLVSNGSGERRSASQARCRRSRRWLDPPAPDLDCRGRRSRTSGGRLERMADYLFVHAQSGRLISSGRSTKPPLPSFRHRGRLEKKAGTRELVLSPCRGLWSTRCATIHDRPHRVHGAQRWP